jgi:hypothetical protein
MNVRKIQTAYNLKSIHTFSHILPQHFLSRWQCGTVASKHSNVVRNGVKIFFPVTYGGGEDSVARDTTTTLKLVLD